MTGTALPDPTVTLLLPAVLDDDAVAALRAGMYEVAGNPAVGHIRLDGRELRAISPRGLGLLAAVRLLARKHGATVCALRCTQQIGGRLAMVRIPVAVGEDHDACSDIGGQPDRSELDWTPWWTSAAANA